MANRTNKTPTGRRRGPKKGIRVQDKKLGKLGAVGYCYPDEKLVLVDPRQNSKEYLDTLIHELLHVFPPSKHWDEETVNKVAGQLTHHLWDAGFRRIQP